MGNLKIGHVVEAVLWLLLAAIWYAWSFEFDREIEIYKFGASAWPRTILLLIAIAAVGQLVYHWKVGERGASSGMREAASDDAAGEAEPSHFDHRHQANFRWYLWTFFLLSLPFIYMTLPQWIALWFSPDKAVLHAIKLGCAGGLILLYLVAMRGNSVGAMLALPIFFGAMLQDFGFYFLAPVFAIGVMYMMGERRAGWIALITAFIMGLMLMLFVSVLYVGLPTGNISPFYEIGTGLVNFLQ